MISAKVVADSINPWGNRITTMVVTFPRIILAEFNTHRMFSRNTSSSRAIPASKMIEAVETNPFIPLAWQKQHKGMQGYEYITDSHAIMTRRAQWLMARDNAVKVAKELNSTIEGIDGEPVSKQIINRLLEPFMWTTVICTTTSYDNFFNLRCPMYEIDLDKIDELQFKSRKEASEFLKEKGIDSSGWTEEKWQSINKSTAEIHIQALAEAMWDALDISTPKKLLDGEWHIPFGDSVPASNINEDWSIETLIKIATARCARVSYTVIGEEGKEVDYRKDLELHDLLLKEGHMSPFEHCAKAMSKDDYSSNIRGVAIFGDEGDIMGFSNEDYGWCANFRGWIQYRQTIRK